VEVTYLSTVKEYSFKHRKDGLFRMVLTHNSLLLSFALLVPVLAAPVLTAQVPLAGAGTHLAMSADMPSANTPAARNQAAQMFALSNQERIAHGIAPLAWDPALAAAAAYHCSMMAAQGPISHQYPGEPEPSERASQAGAHFTLFEENAAQGYAPASIHQAWMNSPGHRDNMLNPKVDHVGIAVVARGNMLYAVADFSHATQVLTQQQVETAVSNLVQAAGVAAHNNSTGARTACTQDHGLPVSLDNHRPEFIMRWEATALDRLPEALIERIATGRFHEAAVGSCPAGGSSPTFTIYRVAVLLLRPESTALKTYISSTK